MNTLLTSLNSKRSECLSGGGELQASHMVILNVEMGNGII